MKPLKPGDFKVNEVWLIVKVNDLPIVLSEGVYNVFALMDAASAYVLDQTLLKRGESISLDNAKSLLVNGWSKQDQWPKKLIISCSELGDEALKSLADEYGILIEHLPVSSVLAIVKPLQDGFREHFMQSGGRFH